MKKTSSNLLVGSAVVFDFPTQTKQVLEQFRDQAVAEAKKNALWGKTGVIVHTQTSEGCLEIDVRMDEDGQIIPTNRNQISITKGPTADGTEELLKSILAELVLIREHCQLGN